MARILIVDDDEMQRLLGRTFLQDMGHELTFAKDGAEALRFFRQNDVDVVVTDVNMPRIDGIGVIGGVREIDERVPVVVVSGASEQELADAEALGAFAVLPKPVHRDALLKAVERALRERDDDWI